jgi:hypothetical protein
MRLIKIVDASSGGMAESVLISEFKLAESCRVSLKALVNACTRCCRAAISSFSLTTVSYNRMEISAAFLGSILDKISDCCSGFIFVITVTASSNDKLEMIEAAFLEGMVV